MKQKITTLIAGCLLATVTTYAQNTFPGSGSAGIGTTTPHASSLLDMQSTSKGLLIPRMTQANRNAIVSPATSLLIYQTDGTIGYYYYTGSGWLLLNNVRGLNNNIFIGSTAGESTTGNGCIAIGKAALKKNKGRSNLVAIGDSALFNNGTGTFSSFQANYNTAVGSRAMKNNSVGAWNTAFGYMALYSNTTGDYNTAFGSEALQNVSYGVGNTAIGYHTLRFTNGFYNVAVGKDALGSNTTGSDNIAIGKEALFSNTERSGCVAIGTSALYNNGIGVANPWEAADNVAVGFEALTANTTGFDNTAMGYFALHNNDGGFHNTAIGSYSINSNTTGFYNTAIGDNTMTGNTTGERNTAIGHSTMTANTNGTYNTCVGAYSNMNDGLTNSTVLGNNAYVTASNSIAIGNTSVVSIKGQVGFTTFSDARIKRNISDNVAGLKFINALRPVTYQYDIHKQNQMMGVKDPGNWAGKYDLEQVTFSGFIAQEVVAAAQKAEYDFSGVDKSENLLGLRYAEFTVPLVKAVQELDAKNTGLEDENAKLKNRVELLEKTVREMKVCMETICNGTQTKETSFINSGVSGSLSVTPNPSGGKISVSYRIEKVSVNSVIKITGENGSLLQQISLGNSTEGTIEYDLGRYPNGKYLLHLISNNELLSSASFILSR